MGVYPVTKDGKKEVFDKIKTSEDDAPELATILIDKADILGEFSYPNIKYTPAEIFMGKVPALSIDFFSSTPAGGEANKNHAIAYQLREVISSWYNALRNLAIIGLLSVLVYLAIKIIISSSNEQKAKYKESIKNWLVAMCLLFFLHYIMAFTINMTNSFTSLIASGASITDERVFEAKIRIVQNSVPVDGGTIVEEDEIDEGAMGEDVTDGYFKTNLMGAARFQIEYKDVWKKLGYLAIYATFTIYTLMFTYTYLKRLINMAFLTVIAPLVALTYPIDKEGDGKAQAFDMWIKEYVYNALLQPLHLLIYVILINSAMQLAVSNMIYALVALLFFKPAEKLLKEMFNFKNGKTGGGVGDFAKGAIASRLLQGGMKKMKAGGGTGGGGKGTDPKVRTSNAKSDNAPKGIDYLAGGLPAGDPSLNTRGQAGGQNGAGAGGTTTTVSANERADLQDRRNNLQAMLDENDLHFGEDGYDPQEAERYRQELNGLDEQLAGNSSSDVNMPLGGNETGGMIEPIGDYGEESEAPKIKGFKNTLGKVASYTLSKAKNTFADNGGVKGYLAKGAKTALRAGTGMVGAAVGAGIGAATGNDLDDIFTGALGGFATGNMLGGKAGGLASGLNNARKSAGGFVNAAKYGEKEAASMQADKEFMKNKENRQFFRQKYGTKNEDELKTVMQKAVKYRQAGVTDLDRIKEAIDVQGDIKTSLAGNIPDEARRNTLAEKQSIELAKLSDRFSDDVFVDQARYDRAVKALSNRFQNVEVKQGDTTRNLTEAESMARAEESMRLIKKMRTK